MLYLYEMEGSMWLSSLDPDDTTVEYATLTDMSIAVSSARRTADIETERNIISNVLHAAGIQFTSRH